MKYWMKGSFVMVARFAVMGHGRLSVQSPVVMAELTFENPLSQLNIPQLVCGDEGGHCGDLGIVLIPAEIDVSYEYLRQRVRTAWSLASQRD